MVVKKLKPSIEPAGTEAIAELCILTASVLLGIHISKWGVVFNNFYLSFIVIVLFIVIGISLKNSLKKKYS